MNPARRYAQTQATTASRERLMVMLFQAALRHIRQGITHCEAGERSDAATSLTKASEIVAELNASLDHGQAPQLSQQLASLYVFVINRLARAAALGDTALAIEADKAFTPIVEAFTEAVNAMGEGTAESR